MPSIPWRRWSALLCLVLTCLAGGWHGESAAADSGVRHPAGTPGEVRPPQIPTEDFEWNGTFRIPGQREPVVTALTIRGMWQDGYFNLYLQQGSEGDEYWVENLIHQNHLYTITHKWPGVDFPVTGACYKTHDEVTVHGLNGILASSQLVGLEQIEGTPMHHFRVSCLSTAQIIILLNGLKVPLSPPIPVSIFSDIYVRPGRSRPFERWLQFGDAVGLSRQNDEWFFFDEHTNHPRPFQLPPQCAVPILLSQGACRNLTQGQ